ncbi:MAG: AI-2E family transporter [Pseudomonadales bacterium]|nr:AI-2E family transporter [Pseudomonadales bacterium]
MKLIRFAIAAILVALVFYLLIVAQDLLLPLVIAIAIWYLINVLASVFAKAHLGGRHLPRPISFLAAILVFLGFISIVVQFISDSLNDLGPVAREYEVNLRLLWDSLPFSSYLPMEGLSQLVSERLDISGMVTTLALSFTSLARDGMLIMIYVGFLLYEQGNFNAKLTALMGNESRERQVLRILQKVRADIQKYISIKLFTSSLTGILSYGILRLLDIDFPEVWGLLIFLLNFIPTIGSIVATLFPTLIALAQSPDGYGLSLLVLIGIGSLQVSIGNILEPRLMGTSLNLSPLVILFNLALWGSIWGIPGMFLCVPLLIITTIILSHFPKTRPVAVLLSSNGKIDITED